MSTSPIWVDGLRESNVGGVVARDHALGVLDGNHGLHARGLVARVLEPSVIVGLAIPDLEAAFDVDCGAAALHGLAMVSGGGFQRHGRKSTRGIRVREARQQM